MPEAARSIHPITFAVYYETTQGEPPGYVESTSPGGTAAGWAAAEGTTAFRMRVEEADFSFIRGEASVEDPRMQSRIFRRDKMIHGLRTADGGSVVVSLHGSEAVAAAGDPVAPTALSRLLGHLLGGVSYTRSTTVTALASNTSYDLTVSTDADEGLVVAPVDPTSGLAHPQRILTLAGDTVGTSPDLPFTLANGDVVAGAAVAYIDPDALENPGDPNASTVSVHFENAGQSWDAVGCRLQLDEIRFERGRPPALAMSVFGASGYPPGDGSPGVVTWTGSVTGQAGVTTGANTYFILENKGTSTRTTLCVESVTVTPGVPVQPIDVQTECDDNWEGRAGYTTTPTATVIEVQALFSTDFQGDWNTDQELALTYYQAAAPGAGWALICPEVTLMETPLPSEMSESRAATLRFVCYEDESLDAIASDLNSARSKMQIVLF